MEQLAKTINTFKISVFLQRNKKNNLQYALFLNKENNGIIAGQNKNVFEMHFIVNGIISSLHCNLTSSVNKSPISNLMYKSIINSILSIGNINKDKTFSLSNLTLFKKNNIAIKIGDIQPINYGSTVFKNNKKIV